MRVIVAGGGIVGLTAAAALGMAGADVLVCEQAPEIRAVGASIGLWRNALDVFEGIGIGDQIRELGTTLATWFYDARGNPRRAPGFGEVDHTFQLLPRPQLNELLANAADRRRIRLGSRVTGFEEHAGAVTVHFADGGSEPADLLVGADGVHSLVRAGLVPGFPAQEHVGHHAWRATLPSHGEPAGGSVLTVGEHRTRGGFTRTYGGQVVWMVNQFDCPPLSGTPKEEALSRARHLGDGTWNAALLELIEATPDEAILHNQIMFVPSLPRWTSDRVVLVGDAAHGLSPHVSAGGTLGVEDIGVLARELTAQPDVRSALEAYESNRTPRYDTVRDLSLAVEHAADAREYAEHYAIFSHWMLTQAPTAA
jgi:salicylate hydroxylase